MADQQPADPAPAQPKAKRAKAKVKQGATAEDDGATAKKGKKQRRPANANPQGDAASDPALAPEAAARQIMQNFLGN